MWSTPSRTLMIRIRLAILATMLAFLFLEADAIAQIPAPLDAQNHPALFNLQLKTLGGQQFWSDVRFAGGWKIQRNSETGHFRLIDPRNVRHAWGSRDACERELNRKIQARQIVRDRGSVVILLHGLSRTNNSMNTMATFLQQQGGYTVANLEYASSRAPIGTHAADLRSVIDSLDPQVTEINFVCHSLGNLVVRRYLADGQQNGAGRDPRIHRMVMLGPPNQGSKMARMLKDNVLFQTFAGASGAQLSVGWAQLKPSLAVPDFEFGIIAGGNNENLLIDNFLLAGGDDITVSLEEAKLPGARDLWVQPLLHGTMMHQPEVLAVALQFLQDGYFVSEELMQPIAEDWQPEPELDPK